MSKLLAVVLLLGAVVPIAASADEIGPISIAERMCDYCGDYSDAATSSGVVNSPTCLLRAMRRSPVIVRTLRPRPDPLSGSISSKSSASSALVVATASAVATCHRRDSLVLSLAREVCVKAVLRLAAVWLVAGTALSAHAAEPNLTTGQWSIVEMGGKPLRTPATINFTRARWLGLNTSCGPLWGWYTRSGAALRIHIAGRGRFQAQSGSPCQGVDYHLLLGRIQSSAKRSIGSPCSARMESQSRD